MYEHQKHALTLAAATLLAAGLSGCVGAIVGGAAVGGASAIDRRSTGAQADDEVMELRIRNTANTYLRQNNAAEGFEPKLAVVSYNRHILLLGQVATEGEKTLSNKWRAPSNRPKRCITTSKWHRKRAPSAM